MKTNEPGTARSGPPADLSVTAIYEQWAGYVKAVLRHRGVPDRLLEEATHDVFQVVLRRLSDYDEERGSLKKWLAGIAVKVAIQVRRQDGREPLMTNQDDTEPEGVDPEPRLAAHDLVHRYLVEIPSVDQRVAFVLFHLGGFTAEEIAKLLKVPMGTVTNRLRLAWQAVTAAARRDTKRGGAGALVIPLFGLGLNEIAVPPMPDDMKARIWTRLLRSPYFPKGERHGADLAVDASVPPRGIAPHNTASIPRALHLFLGILIGGLAADVPRSSPVPEPAPVASVAALAGGGFGPHETPGSAAPLPFAGPASAGMLSPASSAPPAASAGQPRARSAPGADERIERALLDRASDALVKGDMGTALAAVQDHARRFRGSPMAEDREVTWIAALIRSGKVGEARERVERLARTHPRNAHLPAFRQTLGIP